MVKNNMNVLRDAYADAKILNGVKELLLDAKGTNDLVFKRDTMNTAFRRLYMVADDDNTSMLSNLINLALEIKGSGPILNNNIDRVIAVAIKELRECLERLNAKIKNA